MLPMPYFYFFAGFFGLCWGSFLNVVIHRLPLGESIVFPRSRCPSCKTQINWYQNFPIFSFIFLKGKCSNCGIKISLRYPLVEALTAFSFVAVAFQSENIWSWPFSFFFFSVLIAGTFIDLDHWLLPDKLTLSGIVVGFCGSLTVLPISPLNSFLGILFGGGILYLIAWLYLAATKKDGLGGGDIKFLAMVGAFLGIKGALITLIISSFLGSILGIFLILAKGRKTNTAIPFGPFLAAGSALAFFFGEPLWEWYFRF
jgi:leader peptidase (prepilin peptidase) / N-methyltransferase